MSENKGYAKVKEKEMRLIDGSERDIDGIRIFDKMTQVKHLPTYDECYRELSRLIRQVDVNKTVELFTSRGFYTIVNRELVDALALRIRVLGPEVAVEVAAGSGKLAFWLRRKGIDIIPTDIGSETSGPTVEPLDHAQALEKYNPDLVLMAMGPKRIWAQMAIRILSHGSVKHLVMVEKANLLIDNCSNEIKKLATFERFDLPLYPNTPLESRVPVEESEQVNAIFTVLARNKSGR